MKKTTIKIVMALLCPKHIYLKQKIPVIILMLCGILNWHPLFGQINTPVKLIGTVKAGDDLKPLPGATIKIGKSGNAVTSDQNGKFQILTRDTSGVLFISFIGYRTAIIPFNQTEKGPYNIILASDPSVLKEVIVSTGYQTLPKERSTGSFAQIDNQLLNRRVSTDIASRLEGVVPGLLFNRNTVNGSAGNVDISIRGTNTLFANSQPLVIVDGFPYDGDITNINPNDIESITVLKDAAAASIWGVKSGNGVLVLTTKKGSPNLPLSIDFNANLTIGNKPDLFYSRNFINSSDMISLEENLFNKGYFDSNLKTGYVPVSPVIQLLAGHRDGTIAVDQLAAGLSLLANNDIRKDETKYLYRHSVNQQYSLNFKGGGEKSDYFLSLGDDQDKSFYQGNKNSRITVNSRLNFYPIKNLQFSIGANYVQLNATTNNPLYNYGNLAFGSNNIYPYAQLKDANGNAAAIPKDYAKSYTDTVGNGKLTDWNYKPLDELHNADNTLRTIDNRVNLGLNYRFLKDFRADIKYQYEHSAESGLNYNSLATYYSRNLINIYSQINPNGTVTYPIPIGGILQQSDSYLTSQQLRGQLEYNHNWNDKNELTAILGSEISSTENGSNSNTVYGYDQETGASYANIDYATSYGLNPNGAATIPSTLGFGKTTDHFLSYYSNAAYTYDHRYTISLSGRIDKSNLFGVSTNQKSVPLYSTGAAWNISKEGFYHLTWLPYLKLRATFGYTGNINKSATAVATIRQLSNNYYSGDTYNQIANPGNPDLRWEKNRMTNIGLDFTSKNQIVSGSIEYYSKKGIDLFGNSLLAPSTGLSTYFGNTADTKGNGLDLVLNTRIINGSKFKWNNNFILSHATDIVTKYDVTSTSSNYIAFSNSSSIIPLTGKSLYGIYSYSWAGLNHQTGDPQGYIDGKVSTNYSGILANTNINNMVYNGSSRPTTFGSFRNTFTYNDISLSFNIVYKLDYYFRKTSLTSSGLPYSGNEDYYKRWQKPGDELITSVPSLQYPPYTSGRDQFYQYSTALIDKGDHIRLQDISLSYDLYKSNIKNLPINHLQLYGYVNNVGILWRANHDGLDPDLSGNTASAAYPLPRTFALGIKANF
ncbi:SusC/RagA family TonB-linked outer membrane protein [Mucilaginibacter rubeus]|uniref:SusC/RagA family TonB-linked outer membrane protein n=1 Tax=Mucilaginibacter rubeus TaxID=2027860 RepID=A0AAE6MJ49_9SPHI|nr:MULTISPECIES: SusC/RagA family TonB-linked outer membrane protein [Mucilaginibacter]QEM04894.1 SusC/RagA family TonB-linked outer membrane protein [Mucilaginibacter rubeus]QEM17488.1 SusC/RagA family TonB-linked outer membrane protein [Mucilaginibacter gossypii]QTE45991.1 SusC/RagA family TonB-linked outer membrane protein [Mucilaginibacter rubeus]QTE52588.1 SusC/RagA family TonB-linked outer membrane protein [Mucilaginibacter rubeus]QTE57677.1 SusC/RagA family TonB-linked outer membrane pr